MQSQTDAPRVAVNVWDVTPGVPRSNIHAVRERVRATFSRVLGAGDARTGAPPSVNDTAAIVAAAFVLSLAVLLVARPPLLRSRPKNEYERPRVSYVALVACAAATAAAAGGLRWCWN